MYISIFDCCFYHAITGFAAIEYAEDIPLINYQNLTCCARCKIKKLHLENNELQRQLFNNTALNLKCDRFSKCKKKREGRFYISVLFNVLLNVFLRLVLFNVFLGGLGVGYIGYNFSSQLSQLFSLFYEFLKNNHIVVIVVYNVQEYEIQKLW